MSETVHDLLMACHSRIRRFCAGLDALAQITDLGDERIQPTARACQRYFSEALALHAEDEEERILPHLELTLSPSERDAVQRMRREHDRIDEVLPIVLSGLDAMSGPAPAAAPAAFGEFTTLLLEHIRQEEALIFPALERIPPSQQAEIVAQMRARRAPPLT